MGAGGVLAGAGGVLEVPCFISGGLSFLLGPKKCRPMSRRESRVEKHRVRYSLHSQEPLSESQETGKPHPVPPEDAVPGVLLLAEHPN